MTELELSQIIDELSFINEEFYASKVAPNKMDELLSEGWRHFGSHFLRYNLGFYDDEVRLVLPLRIKLDRFALSKSQRRILRRNSDLDTVFRLAQITSEKEILFESHKKRFKSGVPDSIFDFLDCDAAGVPCETMEVCVFERDKLLAASFFDVGATAVSAIYAMFDPRESERSLGIFTMLLTIDFAIKNGKTFYYPGYAYEGNSFYDYKKRFSALEKFDWKGNWQKFNK